MHTQHVGKVLEWDSTYVCIPVHTHPCVLVHSWVHPWAHPCALVSLCLCIHGSQGTTALHKDTVGVTEDRQIYLDAHSRHSLMGSH